MKILLMMMNVVSFFSPFLQTIKVQKRMIAHTDFPFCVMTTYTRLTTMMIVNCDGNERDTGQVSAVIIFARSLSKLKSFSVGGPVIFMLEGPL